MAKSKSRHRQNKIERVVTINATPVRRSVVLRPVTKLALQQEDRRLHHPDAIPPARATIRSATQLVARDRKSRRLNAQTGKIHSFFQPLQTKALIAFADPSRVSLCARRYVRKAVLHAKGIAGSRVNRFRKRRRNAYSSISCR